MAGADRLGAPAGAGRLKALLPRRPGSILLCLLGLLALAAAVAPSWLTPYHPTQIDARSLLQPPSWKHWLGTDELGSDVLARILYGTRLEVAIAMGSVALAALVAVPAGLLAGYRGGRADYALTIVADAILSFPIVLFAVMVVASLGASLGTLIGVLGIVFVPRIFRLVRGQTQVLTEQGFVRSARSMGAGTGDILLRHILPNILGPIMVIVPQLMAVAILIEAGLSFIGLGVQPPQISWGSLMLVSKNYYVSAIWYPLSVGAVTTIASAALVFAGDMAGNAINPDRRTS
ncbi:ABC transporter permease [Roseisalinus antarcticus]|uniref:Glutathione transport system permease protein GsiD n=1 Tax=Roseisalinus antarcticus TaxID=254357 RepID=A0A1Y5TZ29_9RHOB|nr:ABC transporter permease [Roseisalinus antarcticus]SLN72157.1 Glutathione transport system permease protein GsiD [Roseisalinus antarcticus]